MVKSNKGKVELCIDTGVDIEGFYRKVEMDREKREEETFVDTN